MMSNHDIAAKTALQRRFLNDNPVIPVAERKAALRRLQANIREMTPRICAALKADLNKSPDESYATEIGLVLSEIGYMLKRMPRLAKKRRVRTPLFLFPAASFRVPSAYGIVAIVSPWNYPFMLALQPLVDAVAAGNTVVVKPSELSPRTADVISELLSRSFPPERATTVVGGPAECSALLDGDVDYVFFTGSDRVGKIVARKAAERLIPATLELGGKSPCVVDGTADLKLAARRIVFGKLLNAGQTCVAPDYLYCQADVKHRLVKAIAEEVFRQYSSDPLSNDNYPRIVNRARFESLVRFIRPRKVLFGGRYEEEKLMIEPTLVEADFDDPLMREEIFGPILPVITFDRIDEAIARINTLPPPLAFYVFSDDKKVQDICMEKCRFGGGCVNDTVMQIANHHLGFGGMRHSGLGEYHGKVGFAAFTHYKSIIKNSTRLDLPLRYQPFTKIKRALIKFFLR